MPHETSGDVRWELVSGRVSPGSPWCVCCDAPADEGSHTQCRRELDCTAWTPCLTCVGGGVLPGNTSCVDCRGLGFWPVDSPMAMFGGYTVLAEAYMEMAATDPAHEWVLRAR